MAKANEKVKNQRTNFIHKVSNQLVNDFGTIAVETITISNMIRNHKLAKSIADASWSEFIEILQYKAESAGRDLLYAPPYEPTTRRCSNCGNIKTMALSERIYDCPNCGFKEDRDINAAKNILSSSRAGDARIHACGEMTSTSFVREMRVDSSKQELYA